MVLGRRALWRTRGDSGGSLDVPGNAGTAGKADGAAAADDDLVMTEDWDADATAGAAGKADGGGHGLAAGGAGGDGKGGGGGGVGETMEIMLEDGLQLTVEVDSGEKLLNELGYKQELKRALGFFELFSIGLSTVTVFTGIVPYYGQAYVNGGPVAIVWYWWITVFFTHLIALSMAEISSSFPVAGSLYFWSAALAGPKHGPFAAWITGWLEFLGLSVGLGGVSYGGVLMLQYTVLVATGGANGGGYLLTNYQSFAITAGAIIFCGILNSFSIKFIGRLAVISAVYQMGLAIVIMILLPSVAPVHQTPSFVFTHYDVQLDVSLLPTVAYAFVAAMQLSQYSLYAYDTVAHMAEETKRSDRTSPASMVLCLSAVSLLAWGLLVAFTFCIQDDANLTSPDSVTGGQQILVTIIWEVFLARFGTGTGAVVLLSLIYVAFLFGVFAGILAASRAAYAISRDKGLPFAYLWRRVNREKTPIYSVWLCCGVAILFSLPLLKDAYLFTAITSLATVAWVGGYAVPIFFRLIQREEDFEPGPFYLSKYVGVWGRRLMNVGAIFFVLFTVSIFMLPVTFPITATNFNYACVGIFAVVSFFLVWWFLDARNWFVGPFLDKAATNNQSKYAAGRWFM
ncbi:hypothetical protein CLOM_g17745 [Closterium sp. NIES-68]|nr:hypothetical protein CLOM_g17745 [Closterium sp. NIES-68]GJP83554.1 hypothetical protein CLOP_g13689 [Closterium sp. NIES-67]